MLDSLINAIFLQRFYLPRSCVVMMIVVLALFYRFLAKLYTMIDFNTLNTSSELYIVVQFVQLNLERCGLVIGCSISNQVQLGLQVYLIEEQQ